MPAPICNSCSARRAASSKAPARGAGGPHATPEWQWRTGWFPINERVVKFLHDGETWGRNIAEVVAEIAPHLQEDHVHKRLVADGMKAFVTLPVRGGAGHIRASLTLLS